MRGNKVHIFAGELYYGQDNVIYGEVLCGRVPRDRWGFECPGDSFSSSDSNRSKACPSRGGGPDPELQPFDLARVECKRCRELYEVQAEKDLDVWLVVDDVLEGRQGPARGGQRTPSRRAA